jgi:hypothetical protein
MVIDTDRDRDGDDNVPIPPVYSGWGIVLRAVVLAAIITGAAYFATIGFMDLVFPPR